MANQDDPGRIEDLIERSSLGSPNTRRLRGRVAPDKDSEDYTAGYRDGENSRTADVLRLFYDACTMDGLLADFREVMGNPDLKWPEPVVDWRDMFAKYAGIVEACEGVTFLSPPGTATPGTEEWTPGEWAAIEALPGWR